MTPLQSDKELEEILNDLLLGVLPDGKWDINVEYLTKAKQALLKWRTESINQARIEELTLRLSDLSYACGYTDNQPFLKNELEIVKERIDDLTNKLERGVFDE